MKRLSQQEFKYRLMLFKKGYSDREIAERLGCYPNTIRRWRIRNGLKRNPIKPQNVPYTIALPPEKQPIIRDFLIKLKYYAANLPQNSKNNVGTFIKEYRRRVV